MQLNWAGGEVVFTVRGKGNPVHSEKPEKVLFLSFSLWTTCQQREQTHPGRALLKQGSWISRGLVFTRWRSTLSFSFPLHFILQVLIVTVTAGLCHSKSVIIDQQWLLLFKVRTPAPMEEAINNTLHEVNYWYTQLWAHTQGTPHQALCVHVCVCVSCTQLDPIWG